MQLLLRTLGSTSTVALEVAPDVRLRTLQPMLCKLFAKAFPTQRASLVVGTSVYDLFESQPFLGQAGQAVIRDISVVFVHNSEDAYFYDLADRQGQRATVEDEFYWEAEAAKDAAVAAEGCEAWAARRRVARRCALP
jgi:hypothetical protein